MIKTYAQCVVLKRNLPLHLGRLCSVWRHIHRHVTLSWRNRVLASLRGWHGWHSHLHLMGFHTCLFAHDLDSHTLSQVHSATFHFEFFEQIRGIQDGLSALKWLVTLMRHEQQTDIIENQFFIMHNKTYRLCFWKYAAHCWLIDHKKITNMQSGQETPKNPKVYTVLVSVLLRWNELAKPIPATWVKALSAWLRRWRVDDSLC